MPVNRRSRRRSLTERLSYAFVTRTAAGRILSGLTAELHGRVIPRHWSNLWGVVSVASVIVIFVTGVFLMFFYTPSAATVVYDGPYGPLRGAEMSEALRSTLRISFEVPGGLLVRQLHHWAALLLPAAIILQLLTTFFTGAFRKPRRLAWVLLFFILVTALAGGWSGYGLPDDLLSGSGLRIVQGITLGIPVIGTWASTLLFGGEFPGNIIANLYPIHVAVVPALLVGLLILRIRTLYINKPAQFPGPGRTEDNVVGLPMFPQAAARAGGLMLTVMGILVLMAATVTVSPVWTYGPAEPGDASAGSQPDWYTGFLDGALRLVPPGWEFVWLDRTWTLAILVPLAAVGVFLLAVLLYPFIEQWLTGDDRDHNLLDRPRNTPTRTGIGVAGIVFYGSLWGAGSADLLVTHFMLAFEHVIAFFQASVILGPIVAFFVTRRVCLALQKKDREIVLHGFETGRIVRLPGGEYIEVHQPVEVHERFALLNTSNYEPYRAQPDDDGKLSWINRLRARIARAFFEYRLDPMIPPGLPEATAPDHADDRIKEVDTTRQSARSL